ncbi:PorV/PorQ family protein [Candidatus Poribacteria bacterium]|nr:PorV/PorQ family protein [Candidatus Poribacteria bacterium]
MFQLRYKVLFSSIGLFALVVLLAPVCFAGVNAAPHLGMGSGARSLGLGGAFTAVADDATSTIWNPAGLPAVEDLTITLSSARLSLDRRHSFIGLIKRVGNGGLGLSVVNAGVDDITSYNSKGDRTGSFNHNSNAFALSYGHDLGAVSLGASARMYTDSFGDHSSTSGFAGADIGLLGHNKASTFSYGIAARNLGSAIGDNQVPVKIAGGLAYRVLDKNVATFSVDVEHEVIDLPESPTSLHIGTEYLIANTFAIRGGTKLNTDRTQLFAGFGVNVGGLQLDYALKAADSAVNNLDDDSTHFFSISYSY